MPRRYGPDLVVVPANFDAAAVDPLGRTMLHDGTCHETTRHLTEVAEKLRIGRLALSHEGGHPSSYVPYCGLAVMEHARP